MSTVTDASFRPVARVAYLDRLAVSPARSDLIPEIWNEVHEAVQRQLALLDNEVLRDVAGVRVDAGRTRGDKFFLFSYRTLSVADSQIDPVVVGMTFTPAQPGITVEADISGEQSGDMIFLSSNRNVAGSSETLRAAADALAQELCRQSAAIAAALQDPSRRIE